MTSSTFLETGALGKMPSAPERLRDDDGESFGKSRQAYAFERKISLRKKARAIRERSRATVMVLPRGDEPLEIFEALSIDARELGIRSYKIEVAERESVIGRQVRCFGATTSISLPYVSILGASR